MSSTSKKELLKALKSLSATDFENVVFDLVTAAGLQNPSWRTPGADGGRDIEGIILTYDFSGHLESERWYVECKRYDRALNWPTVRDKVAYAENHFADFLLLVTTAHLSPQCQSEAMSWNKAGRRPRIRAWDASQLPLLLQRYGHVALKHGLPAEISDARESLLRVARESLKSVQTAYAEALLKGTESRALEAAAAVAELLAARLASAESVGRFVFHPYDQSQDSYEWLKTDNPDALEIFDRTGLRAFLAFLRFAIPLADVTIRQIGSEFSVDVNSSPRLESQPLRAALTEIALWSDVEISFKENAIVLRARARHD